MIHEPFSLIGQTFDLSHLSPRELLCPRMDDVERHLRIAVTFSHHIYTSTEEPDPDMEELLRVFHRGERRYFDQVRWKESVAFLPAMVDELPGARVEFAHEVRNFRYAAGALIVPGMQYAMFFSLRRHNGPEADLKLFVESAYPAPVSTQTPAHIRFRVLAAKVMKGEKVTKPPRR